MRILLFKERDRISPDELQKKLVGKENVIEKLKLANVLLHKIPLISLDEFITEDEELVSRDTYYSFKFVGILLVDDVCFIVYPKYIKNAENDYLGSKNKIIQIVNVIDKFQRLNTYNNRSDEANESFLTLMIHIMRQYLEYGLYSSDEVVIETNGEGDILWEKTINEKVTYLVDNSPFYLDFYTNKAILNEEDIVRRLHAAIINEINLYLQPLLPIFDIPEFVISEEVTKDFGDSGYLEYILEKELSRQFVTSKQNLLHDLLHYIRYTGNSIEINDVEIYGTSSFNLVWEDICKKIYKNDLEKELSSLDLTLSGIIETNDGAKIDIDYQDKKLLKDIIDKPIWKKLNSLDSIVARKSLELDVLHVNHNNLCFEIFDGKYHTINITDGSVSGQPGVSDITKQYLYQLAYKKLATINGYKFTNTFVVPKDDFEYDEGFGAEIAIVELEMLHELGLQNIKVVARDCEVFYSQYLGF